MMDWNDSGWGVGGWLMMLLMVGFCVALIVFAVWLVQSLRSGDPRPEQTRPTVPSRSADDIIAERLARGEITEDEFTRRHNLLHPRESRT